MSSRIKVKCPILLSVALVLLAAIIACGIATFHRGTDEAWVSLATRMPPEIGGWIGEDVPLGQTEAVLEAIGRLNYEDYIYRVYRKGSEEVYVYAMYWRQGQISVREMSGHTPDGCWVSNGARHCAPAERRVLTVDGRGTAVAEARSFEFPSTKKPINVVWWHIWGDQLVDRSFAKKALMPMLREVWVWLAHRGGQQRDQLLIRIHSELPMADVEEVPPVQAFLKVLPVVFDATPIAGGAEE